jgi:RNA polymerase-binding transcription factor DksA
MNAPADDPGCDTAQLAALKQALLRKGSEINEKLTRLLAGESFDIERLLVGGEPGETPIERLQRFLGIVDERLRAMREGRYGRCEKCGKALSFAALQEAPWVTLCPACDAAA